MLSGANVSWFGRARRRLRHAVGHRQRRRRAQRKAGLGSCPNATKIGALQFDLNCSAPVLPLVLPRTATLHYCGLLELWPEEDSGGHLEGHRRAELRSLGRHFSARRRSRSAGRTAASTGRYWMVRSIVYHGWPCSCRSCRTAFFMPDPRRAQPGVEMAVFGARSFPHGLFERR